MLLIPVKSDAIRAVGYASGTLAVRFHSSDTVYTHPRVPLWVFVELLAASSKGAYYARKIRGKYK